MQKWLTKMMARIDTSTFGNNSRKFVKYVPDNATILLTSWVCNYNLLNQSIACLLSDSHYLDGSGSHVNRLNQQPSSLGSSLLEKRYWSFQALFEDENIGGSTNNQNQLFVGGENFQYLEEGNYLFPSSGKFKRFSFWGTR